MKLQRLIIRKLSNVHDGGSDPKRTLRYKPINGHGHDHAIHGHDRARELDIGEREIRNHKCRGCSVFRINIIKKVMTCFGVLL